jgi:EAL domain-containing protein (putative c-di-GMP-specific phosphodiesterase class I)
VRNLLSLARAFNLETVAECVEDADAAAYLAQEGLDFLQGWHFGRPELEPAWRVAAGPAVAGQAPEPPLRVAQAAT